MTKKVVLVSSFALAGCDSSQLVNDAVAYSSRNIDAALKVVVCD